MNQGEIINIVKESITVALKISAPMLLTAVVVGVIISIIQATTQIQEQTLTFVPKLLGLAVVGILFSSFMINNMLKFTDKIFTIMSGL
ncbi:flagellar biosynthesis protein FliQ [Clostridium sp.]|uniref:flagellar biosynthesis protein FliQ n=1 Tax=Clostridium sp. TaxID=1506 RepID=UPI001B3D88E0|nr:flagellar biosynthesis protein FliQ [Clostridium sp.]MBP3917390.1 flagellar biosynthesis protein FliQ [Clostridium sp.]